ncbi:AbrB/MazE/SpoVT family DNA-binding domain-containing protein [Candidatus Bathyarchaeota archaeon]|nr:AbrB/MazE/SpoVT family DNA-binding domain-containing protein [Candidatus Bathyarchaeota archaeon]
MHKETRKIIRVGNSLAVTMPPSWLRYFNLTDKDRVTVLSDGNVVIQPIKREVEPNENK